MTTQICSIIEDTSVIEIVLEKTEVLVVEQPATPVVEELVAEHSVVEVMVPGMQGPAVIGDSSYPVYVGDNPPLNTQLLWLDTSDNP